jgi:nicotinamide riboside kinase
MISKPLKIAFTGPESTGKSTLSYWLSEEIKGVYCEEFAREYLCEKINYTQEDLNFIAQGQIALWQNFSRKAHLVADTELTVLEIWSQWKYKSCDSYIIKELSKQKFDLYFLCKPDFPWEFDPLRESPNDRDELFHLYESSLRKNKFNYKVLQGSLNKRKSTIKQILRSYNIVF